MKSKGFYEALLKAIDLRCSSDNDFIIYEDLQDEVGDYWRDITEFLQEEGIGERCWGGIKCRGKEYFRGLRPLCLDSLEEIRKNEESRILQIEEIKINIENIPKAKRLSLFAVIIASLSLLSDVITKINWQALWQYLKALL